MALEEARIEFTVGLLNQGAPRIEKRNETQWHLLISVDHTNRTL
jgi:hypothetical protein